MNEMLQIINSLSIDILIWIGIVFCISQSAIFSGLNLAFFSVSRLRLEIEARNNDPAAIKVLKMRSDSNFLLTTILWGNVGVNVLLALLSNSVMTGISAFIFSTFIITFLGEIAPQAYFSRHALRIASTLLPVIKIYQIILFPVAKPSAKLLDLWLGEESIEYFKEKSLKHLIQKHVEDAEDIDHVEGTGAINFLAIDDLMVGQEGEPIDPDSIISLPFRNGKPVFPKLKKSVDDPFLKKIHKSQKKWIIITDEKNIPRATMEADGFLRSALLELEIPNPHDFCHSPIIVLNSSIPLGRILKQLESMYPPDDVIHKDIILLWGDDQKRIITGADILGRLLRGISRKVKPKES